MWLQQLSPLQLGSPATEVQPPTHSTPPAPSPPSSCTSSHFVLGSYGGGRRVNFIFTQSCHSLSLGEVMVGTEAGNCRRGLKQRPWRLLLPGVLLLACSARSLIKPRTDYLPKDGPGHSRLGPPTSVTNQENARQPSLPACLMEAFSQLRFCLR